MEPTPPLIKIAPGDRCQLFRTTEVTSCPPTRRSTSTSRVPRCARSRTMSTRTFAANAGRYGTKTELSDSIWAELPQAEPPESPSHTLRWCFPPKTLEVPIILTPNTTYDRRCDGPCADSKHRSVHDSRRRPETQTAWLVSDVAKLGGQRDLEPASKSQVRTDGA